MGPCQRRTTIRLFVSPRNFSRWTSPSGKSRSRSPAREEVHLLPGALLPPPEREVGVEPALQPLGKELEEGKLVVRLDREPAVGRLHVVAHGHAPDLVSEGGLELLWNMLDHGVRERERELAIGEGKLRRVGHSHGHIVLVEPFALAGLQVYGDDVVCPVEPLERGPRAGAHVENALPPGRPGTARESGDTGAPASAALGRWCGPSCGRARRRIQPSGLLYHRSSGRTDSGSVRGAAPVFF